MTSIHATLGTLALACCIAFMSAAARAQDVDAGRRAILPGTTRTTPLRFDIAAQALRSALDAFGGLTGLGVLVDSDLTQRITTAVHGEYAPQEALRKMLAGTGLQARYISGDTLTIQPAPGEPAAGGRGRFTAATDIPGIMAGGIDYRPYIALVQTRIKQALCRSARTRPGRYRLLVQFWISASGGLQRARLIGSTGDDARDAAVGQVIRDLKVDPPPVSMAQPLVMLLEPSQPGMSDDCRASAAAGRQAP
jgi:TonB family protein